MSLGCSPKQAGETAASAVLDLVPELDHVPDSEAEHYDARASTLVEPSEALRFSGICLLETGVVVEIKSTMAVYGANQSRGRFYLRHGQHEKLLAEAGVYLE